MKTLRVQPKPPAPPAEPGPNAMEMVSVYMPPRLAALTKELAKAESKPPISRSSFLLKLIYEALAARQVELPEGA